MRRSQEEAEVIIRLDYKDKMAHITVNQWPECERRYTKLFGKPDEAGRFVARWKAIPLEEVRVSRRARRSLTPEQRERMVARGKDLAASRTLAEANAEGVL